MRSRVERNVLVSVESAAGESIAAPIPWAKRAPTSSELAVRQAADQRRAGEDDQAGDQHAATAEQVGHAAAEQQEAAVGEDVAVDHPLQALLAEAEVALDRGQRDVEDRRVEHVHELDDAEQEQDCDAAPRTTATTRRSAGVRAVHELGLAFVCCGTPDGHASMVLAGGGASPRGHPQNRTAVFGRAVESGLGAGTRLAEEQTVETLQKLDLLERDTELAAVENLIDRAPAAAACWRSRGHPASARPR